MNTTNKMEYFFVGMIGGFMIGFILSLVFLDNAEQQDIEIATKTQECLRAGGTEYLYWDGICQKVIQERKVETIYFNQ